MFTQNLFVGAALIVLAAPLHAQSPTNVGQRTETQSIDDRFTITEMQADLDVLRAALEEAHGGLYRFATKPEMDRHFDSSRRRIDREMTRLEFIGHVSELLAGIRDGHSRLEYDEATSKALVAARLFPLKVMFEGDRLMVVSNDTRNDSTILPGMEVLQINAHEADEVVARIVPKVPGDGFIQTGKRFRLAQSFATYYWMFVDQGSEFQITARGLSGEEVTAVLPGVRRAEREGNNNPVNRQISTNLARMNGPEERVSLRFPSDPDIAHLRVRSFGGEDFRVSIESAIRTVHERGTKAVILDLRGNGGGVDEYGALLVSQFADRPFRYFDRIHLESIDPSFTSWVPRTYEELRTGTRPDPEGGYFVTSRRHPGVAEQTPAQTPFLGELFVLIDGGTFSTAADVAAILFHLKRGTFVGEETGGAYQGNTSGLNAMIELPNSGLRLKVMMYEYWNAVESDHSGRGTLPDYPVETRVADLLSAIDPPLVRAEVLARRAISANPVLGQRPRPTLPGDGKETVDPGGN